MKKYLIYYFFSFLLITQLSNAQLLPNGDFATENCSFTSITCGPDVIQSGCLDNWSRVMGSPLHDDAGEFVTLWQLAGEGQGLFQGYQFSSRRSYRICIDARLNGPGTSSLDLTVVATSGLPPNPTPNGVCFEPLPGNASETILAQAITNNGTFIRYSSPEFTPTQDFDQLFIYTISGSGATNAIDIDNVMVFEGCIDSEVFDAGFTFTTGTYEYSNSAIAGGTPMVTVDPVAQVDLFAGNFVDLVSDFDAQSSGPGFFNAEIRPCDGPDVCPPQKTNHFANSGSLDSDQKTGVMNMQLVPNPATDIAYMELEVQGTGKASLTMYDLTGKPVRVFFTNREISPGVRTYQLDLADLNSGMYVVRLNFGNEVYQKKISVIP